MEGSKPVEEDDGSKPDPECPGLDSDSEAEEEYEIERMEQKRKEIILMPGKVLDGRDSEDEDENAMPLDHMEVEDDNLEGKGGKEVVSLG